MIHACKGMFVECSTQLRLFLAQFNSGFQFSLKGNMQHAKKIPHCRDDKHIARSKQCFQLWF